MGMVQQRETVEECVFPRYCGNRVEIYIYMYACYRYRITTDYDEKHIQHLCSSRRNLPLVVVVAVIIVMFEERERGQDKMEKNGRYERVCVCVCVSVCVGMHAFRREMCANGFILELVSHAPKL